MGLDHLRLYLHMLLQCLHNANGFSYSFLAFLLSLVILTYNLIFLNNSAASTLGYSVQCMVASLLPQAYSGSGDMPEISIPPISIFIVHLQRSSTDTHRGIP